MLKHITASLMQKTPKFARSRIQFQFYVFIIAGSMKKFSSRRKFNIKKVQTRGLLIWTLLQQTKIGTFSYCKAHFQFTKLISCHWPCVFYESTFISLTSCGHLYKWEKYSSILWHKYNTFPKVLDSRSNFQKLQDNCPKFLKT